MSVPDVQNKFNPNLDYKRNKSRSVSRERFSDATARKIDQDLRSTAMAESETNRRSTYKRIELEDLLRSCKIKKTILKEKLTSAEVKLRDLMRSQHIQRQIEGRAEPSSKIDTLFWKDYALFKKMNAVETRVPSDEEKLFQLKENRAVDNHNLNILRQKIERLRVTENQLLKQAGTLRKKETGLTSKLSMYENLVRENIALKSKLQRASMVLHS